MKAIQFRRYGGPEVLEFCDLPDLEPAEDGVLIEVHACSVAPGDCKLRQGALRQHFDLKLPKVPGRDGTGIVVAVGQDTNYAKIGGRVCFIAQHLEQGAAAELIARRAPQVAPLPDNISFVEGAALTHTAVCAWIGIAETGGVQPRMNVLVHGGGGAIGALAIQVAKLLGASVATTTRSSNADYVTALGADEVIAYDQVDFSAGPRRFDVVFDVVGGEVHRKSYDVLKRGGCLVYLIADPIEDLSAQHGVTLKRAVIHDRVETLETVMALAAKGVLKPQIGGVFPLAQCADAHRLVESAAHTRGRVVLKLR